MTTDTPGIGHNAISTERLRSFVKRVQKLEEEKKAIADDIKEIYAEAKRAGYCPKTLRKAVRLLAMDEQKRREETEMLDLYLGALSDTPLGQAAMRAAQ